MFCSVGKGYNVRGRSRVEKINCENLESIRSTKNFACGCAARGRLRTQIQGPVANCARVSCVGTQILPLESCSVGRGKLTILIVYGDVPVRLFDGVVMFDGLSEGSKAR